LHLGFCLLLLGCGTAGIVRDLLKPYKTEHDREVRHVVRKLAQAVPPGESVLVGHGSAKELLAELSWYLRTELPSLLWLSDGRDQLKSARSCTLFFCDH